jgi:hypothetical protein
MHPTSGLDGRQRAEVVTEPNPIIDADVAHDDKFQTGRLSEPTGGISVNDYRLRLEFRLGLTGRSH